MFWTAFKKCEAVLINGRKNDIINQTFMKGDNEMHTHNHLHSADAATVPELKALLEFTLKHNVSHTGELAQLAEQLRLNGNDAASKKITAALEEYNQGNKLLEEALALVK